MVDRTAYVRHINYYETDQMAVVHHSNYIRFFEEARVFYMKKNGLDFAKLEEKYGIMFPVLDVSCKYFKSARFDDTLFIHVKLKEFTGVRFRLEYTIVFTDGSLCCTGSTTLGILNKSYMPVSVKRKLPDEYARFMQLLKEENENEA